MSHLHWFSWTITKSVFFITLDLTRSLSPPLPIYSFNLYWMSTLGIVLCKVLRECLRTNAKSLTPKNLQWQNLDFKGKSNDYKRGVSKTSHSEVQMKDDNRFVCVVVMAKWASAEYLLDGKPLVYVTFVNPPQTFEREIFIPIYVITECYTCIPVDSVYLSLKCMPISLGHPVFDAQSWKDVLPAGLKGFWMM